MSGPVTVARQRPRRARRRGRAADVDVHAAVPDRPCATVRLVRQRATGTDTLTLHADRARSLRRRGPRSSRRCSCAGTDLPPRAGGPVPDQRPRSPRRSTADGRRGDRDHRDLRQPVAAQPDAVRRRPRARRRALLGNRLAAGLNPQRPQHVRRRVASCRRALGPRTRDDDVQAERPAGGREELLRARPGRDGDGPVPRALNARRIERTRDPARRRTGRVPGSRPAPGRYSVRARNDAPARHQPGAPVAELAVVERKLEVAGVERGAAGRAPEHPAAPARGSSTRSPCASRITCSRRARARARVSRASSRRPRPSCARRAPPRQRAVELEQPALAAHAGSRERREAAHARRSSRGRSRPRRRCARQERGEQRHVRGRARHDRGHAQPELRSRSPPRRPSPGTRRASARRPAAAGPGTARGSPSSTIATASAAASTATRAWADGPRPARAPARRARRGRPRRPRRHRSRRAGTPSRSPPRSNAGPALRAG